MTKYNKNKIWHEVLESVKVSISPAIFSTWLSQTHLSELKQINNKRCLVEVGCSSSFVKTTVEQRYFGLLQNSLAKALKLNCDLVFIVKQNPLMETDQEDFSSPLFEQRNEYQEFLDRLISTRINSHYTFENFAVSTSNQMAWAAAEAVAKKPAHAYNPLFVWGGVGVGKTHLMNAVAYRLLKKNIDAKVFFCTGEEFTNDIVEGIRNKTTQSFRSKYRKLEVLLIDDIQFIAGKDAVQDEFFHTFNAVTAAGGQIILTSDKHPSEIARLAGRLRSRFQAGLIVDISPPDFELRCAIVQIKSRQRKVSLPMDFVQLIAGNINTARELEGFIIRLISETKIKKTEINEELIKNLLGQGMDTKEKRKTTSPEELVSAVCQHFSISKRAMMGQARARIIARPRQILMYLLRTELGLPFEEAGRIVGRDHSTVIHAVNRITQMASTNVQIREDILGIKDSL